MDPHRNRGLYDGLISRLVYQPYAALLIHQRSKAAASRSHGNAGHSEGSNPIQRLSEACKIYRQALVERGEKYALATERQNSCPLHLFRPLNYETLGDTDYLSVLTIDDFDILTELSLNEEITMYQTCVAFCPDMEGSDLKAFKSEYAYSLDKMLLEQALGPPLVLLAHFRLNGLTVLGPGLIYQEAIYSAIARIIDTSMQMLLAITDDATISMPSVALSPRDIKSMRYTILDPQGWSDVAILFQCRNLSVAISAVMAIREMTIADVYAAAEFEGFREELEGAIATAEVNSSFAKAANQFGKQVSGKNWVPVPDSLDRNHVFHASLSLGGLSEWAATIDCEKNAEELYSGIVYGNACFDAPPGHLQELEDSGVFTGDYWEMVKHQLPDVDGYRRGWLILGHKDFNDRILSSGEKLNAVRLFDLVQRLKRICKSEFGSSKNPGEEWAIRDLTTEISVPFYRLKRAVGIDTRHCNVMPLLDGLVHRLFFAGPDAPISYQKLKDVITRLRIPVPISNSILYCFRDFAQALRDPYYFDQVVDLFDVFRSVHSLFTEEFDLTLQRFVGMIGSGQAVCTLLEEREIDMIGRLSGLLSGAISLRTKQGFEAVGHWQSAIDFKTGLTKLVHGVDVPLKCGSGLLRRLLAAENEGSFGNSGPKKAEDRDTFRKRVGGSCLVNSVPRASATRFQLGGRNHYFLIGTDFNISALVRPENHMVLLHELAHYIADLIAAPIKEQYRKRMQAVRGMERHAYFSGFGQDWDNSGTDGPLIAGAYFERYAEVFADSFVYAFFHRGQRITYLRKHFAAFALDPKSLHQQVNATFACATEVLLRMFLATDPYGDGPLLPGEVVGSDGQRPNEDDLKQVIARFEEMVNAVAPFFYEFQLLWNDEARKDSIRENFAREYVRFYPARCEIREKIVTIISVLKEPHGGFNGLWCVPVGNDDKDFITAIKDAYAKGRPVVRTRRRLNQGSAVADSTIPMDNEGFVDMLFLLAQLLRCHDEWLYGENALDRDKAIWTKRSIVTGKIEWNEKELHINQQMLDRTFNGFVSADFERRADYLQRRIVYIKSVWDLSANLRGRRFAEIVKNAFPPERST